jgi:hypothetical protein
MQGGAQLTTVQGGKSKYQPDMAKVCGPWDSAPSFATQDDVEAWIRKKAGELGEDPLSESFAARLGKEIHAVFGHEVGCKYRSRILVSGVAGDMQFFF